MQMVKQATLPKSAMIRSKDGHIMAMTTNATVANMRRANLNMPRLMPDMPFSEEFIDNERLSRPVSTSSVEMIGRALSGILVRGMMAIQMAMKADSGFGYP